jgi:hypothetical protein
LASSSKKNSKSKSDADLPVEADVTDAVIIEETEPTAETDMETVDEMADADGVTKHDDADPIEDEVLDKVDDVTDVTETAVVPVAPVAEPVEQSNPFWALVLGGAVAAGLGFFLAQYLAPKGTDELEARVETQAEAIDGITGLVAENTSQAEVLGATAETLGVTTESLTGDLAAQAEQIAGLEAKIAELTAEINKPRVVASEAELSADLTALIANQKEEIAALQGDLKSMATFAEGQIETAQQEADAAALAEARAQARDGLNTVRLALSSGEAFEDALPLIAGAVEIPAGLSAAASGVATQSELQGSYGAAARSALAASNRELSGDSASDRVGLFFQDMIGARSLTPQDGDSPDAVLSRVEAAVQNGDLSAALTQIDALPENGKAELTEWSEKAKARNDALQAFSDLTDALSAD